MNSLLYKKAVEPGIAIGVSSIVQVHESAAKNQSEAARAVVKALKGEGLLIEKDEWGKPFVTNLDVQISLTHSKTLAAAIVSEQHRVGIDIETIHPRIQRIAHKFLTPAEVEAITTNKVETLLLYWSAKEALYKLYARKQLEFATQLIINPFELKQSGCLKGSIIVPEERAVFADLDVHYEFLEGHILTYVVGR